MTGDYRQLSEDVLNAANTPVWDMLADGGIALDRVNVQGDGTWGLAAGDTMICFGEARAKLGSQDTKTPPGWDWTKYSRIDGEWEYVTQDYAETDQELVDILKAAQDEVQQ